jgi:GH15 family glucan-1,4-alpha-glucosidase
MCFRIKIEPAFNFARDEHTLEITNDGHRAIFRSKSLSLVVESPNIPLQPCPNNKNIIDFQICLKEESKIHFIIREYIEGEEIPLNMTNAQLAEFSNTLLGETVLFWNNWVKKSTYTGRWREMVLRSALTLKLLTYEPTGAIIAAPTTSLPETIGGSRNWDYRYVWIRDSSFVLYAFLRIGFKEEAMAFMKFLEDRCREAALKDSNGPPLQIMYTIFGESKLDEHELHHLSGYKNSKPVRIGNGAYDQLQLDIFGELLDSIYLYNKYVTPISYDFWNVCVKRIVDWVVDNYHLKDESIWEVRGGKQNFVYSKVMCWVCIDRGIRLSEKRSFPLLDRKKWFVARDSIFLDVMNKAWDPERQIFTQSYESKLLDSSCLIMPLVFFMSPTDSRMLSTIDEIMKTPQNGGLRISSTVYRYDPKKTNDGLCQDEGTFSICSLWLVEALARYVHPINFSLCRAGSIDKNRLNEALLLFENMLTYANHCGLFSEEISACGLSLGNFPQAFTHLAFISASFNLDRQLGK